MGFAILSSCSRNNRFTNQGRASGVGGNYERNLDDRRGVMPQKTGARLRNHRANLAPHYIWFAGLAEIGFSPGPITGYQKPPAPKIRRYEALFPKVR
ncbi:MAG TPA: hypothetical protein VG328_00030 [Stellaceae bacterium]|jgi:hypothetical protein|nr:hypothetical protein [Stellaceae bacterium]